MLLKMNEYLYEDYCAQPTRPREWLSQAQHLAWRLGAKDVSSVDKVCDFIQNNTCRITNDQSESVCAGEATEHTVVMQCGTQPARCYDRKTLQQQVAREPAVKLQLGPKQLRLLNTDRSDPNSSCFERRGSRQFCAANQQCEYTEASRWQKFMLGRQDDCQVKQQVSMSHCGTIVDQDNVIIDMFLRFMEARNVNVSRRLKAQVRANLQYMSPEAKCALIKKHQPVPVHKRLNALATMILGTDVIRAEQLSDHVDMDSNTLQNLTAALNLASAALVSSAPWWLYLTLYPSGRTILQQVLNNDRAGQLFVISLLLTGVKGNWIFEDLNGLLDYVDFTTVKEWLSFIPVDVEATAKTLVGLLTRKL
jgi:hypothetical protein